MLLATFLLLAGSASAVAGGIAEHVTITKLHMRRSIGEMLFIRLSSSATGAPACGGVYEWNFVLPTNTEVAKKLYAGLLAAYATHSVITMDGTGTCTDFGGIETMDSVTLEN